MSDRSKAVKTKLCVLLFLCQLPFTVFCQNQPSLTTPAHVESSTTKSIIPLRALGSQTFDVSVALNVPLFLYSTDSSVTNTNLSLGAGGFLQWSAFLNNSYFIGVDAGGTFAMGPNNDAFGLLQVGPRTGFLLRSGIFEFPIALSPLLDLISYKGLSYVGFALKPEFGVFIDAVSGWSFGITASYTWAPEFYTSSPPYSRVGNFLHISLSALYSF